MNHAPRRVAVVLTQLGQGGAEQQTVELLSSLRGTPAAPAMVVCLSRKLHPHVQTLEQLGYHLVVIPRATSFDVVRLLRLRSCLRRGRIDLVHAVHLLASGYAFLASSGGRRPPVLPTMRGAVTRPNWLKRRTYRRMLRGCPVTLVNSRRGARYLVDHVLLFLGALRNAQVDWSRITLYWADERAVPADHNESNYGVAKRMLLDPLGAKAPRAVRMPADRPNLGEAAHYYDATLAHDLKNGPLDLALLGVGEDGHICSLFPGHRALLVDDIRVVALEDAPKPPPRRLSLTLRYVLQTRQIWLIAVGPRKLPALQMVLTRTQRATPLDLLLQQGKNVTVFTDQVIRRG